jgi:prevent-host-death family protein
MKTTNAVAIRRSLGRVLRELADHGEPVIVERNGKAAAVLISVEAFRERFADQDAADERERLVEDILSMRRIARRSRRSAVDEVRALRGPLP